MEREVGEGSHSIVTVETMRVKKGKILRLKYRKVKQVLTGVCAEKRGGSGRGES